MNLRGKVTYIRVFSECLDNPVNGHLEQGGGGFVAGETFGSVNSI